MHKHKWERLERPYQYQIDEFEDVSFLDSRVWVICKKCMRVYSRTVRRLAIYMPVPFLEAGI